MAGKNCKGQQHWSVLIPYIYSVYLILEKGYLPAEHIETPTERLARLNKHRNIDVSSLFLWKDHDPSNRYSYRNPC